MDVFEKRIMRRKRPVLSDTLDFTDVSQQLYREHGLLTSDMFAEIEEEPTDFGKMFKFLQLVAQRKHDSFEPMRQILVELGHKWLADEMRADVMAERGDLEIEEYVYREAGSLVHQHFGGSKRVSEVDKKEFQMLIARRYQAAKEACHSQLYTEQRKLAAVMEEKRQLNRKLKHMLEKLTTFQRVQKARLTGLAHDLDTPSDLIRGDNDPDCSKVDYSGQLEETLEAMLATVSSLLLQKENMSDERRRCIQLLDVPPAVAGHMDVVLEDALERATHDIVKSKRDAKLSDRLAQALESRMRQLTVDADRRLMGMEQETQRTKSELRRAEEKARKLEAELVTTQQRAGETEDELQRWRVRCDLLEKSRRLGYYHPGWYDKLYDVTGIPYDRKKADSPRYVSLHDFARPPAERKATWATTRGSRGARGGQKKQRPSTADSRRSTASTTAATRRSFTYNSSSNCGV
ncbi:hypothetical protein NP493_695g01044 [Ridgeia piscesae]|uniref:Uncharacterized protein n=1 Tax=Ridgeia piscesae TaxID=27915 RepID=A0AAD9NMY2_RIDPI|nr:hypothetical protein NP493_695g01044 [Ridgeia piscesae]